MPEDRHDRANALLNQQAADDVRREPHSSVPPAPADPDMADIAFEGEIYRYVADWMAAHVASAPQSKPFALVLSRSITQDSAFLAKAGVGNLKNYYAFRSQKLIDVRGFVLVVTMNLEHALAVPVASVTSSQQLFDTIDGFGFGERHIAVFEPPHSNLILLRRGLQEGSRTQQVIATGGTQLWKLDQLEAEIAQFHDDYTRTPSGILEPWSNAGKGITGEKLEIRISKALAHHLDLLWKRGSVLAEAACPSGRMDIFLCSHIFAKDCGPCVIEVKVLRSRSKRHAMPANCAEWWAKKGVIQAHLYRKDKAAPSAYLCSFDARDKESDLPAVDALAKKLNIGHKKYFMHRSSGSLQDAELAKVDP
jgi:hypothetical protein